MPHRALSLRPQNVSYTFLFVSRIAEDRQRGKHIALALKNSWEKTALYMLIMIGALSSKKHMLQGGAFATINLICTYSNIAFCVGHLRNKNPFLS